MNVNQVYSVGVTFHNVGESDSIESAIAALKHLYTVTEQVFNRIESKVKSERAKVNAVAQRLVKVSAQIETIGRERVSKATTVFSNAKFPGRKEVESYKPIFSDMTYVDCPPDFLPENAPRVYPANDGNPRAPPAQADMLDLLWRANQTLDLDGTAGGGGAPSGVGPLPDDMLSVTNFMLYNSNETPYTQYDARLDNMFEVKQRDTIEEESKRKMAAQGTTLLGGDNLPANQGLDYTYKATMKAQPTLQFQTNLDFGASLPAVASDAAWSSGTDELSSIAPSAFQSALPALPALMDSSAANALPDAVGGGGGGAPPPSAPPPPPAPSAAPPPPPPPASSAPRATPRGGRPPPTTTGPRPPPPLPPKSSTAAKAPAAKKKAPAARGGLLDAIKAGKSLKSSKKNRTPSKKAQAAVAKKPGAGLSLMDQMKARLGRRANVMSGREDDESQKKNKKKRRMTVVGKTVTNLLGAANRAKKVVAARKVETKEQQHSGSSDSDNDSFNDSDDDGRFDKPPATETRPRRRSSEIADTIISKRPAFQPKPKEDPTDPSVGGFNTKGMAGLTALLAHKKSSVGRGREDSVATNDSDDWDSD